MRTSFQDRLLSALATIIVVALFGYALIVGLTVDMRVQRERLTMLLSLRAPPPPPPPRHVERQQAPRAAGRSSPRNLRSKAAEIVTLPALVPPLLPPPVITASKPGSGMAPSAGASDRAGPGTGAGGEGDGTGAGGEGDGDGGGDIPPRLIKGRLKFSDLPAALRHATHGGTVGVRYDVGVDGRVSHCVASASSGDAALDQATCRLIEERFRFAPSRDPDGAPVPSTVEENHSWVIDRSIDPPQHP